MLALPNSSVNTAMLRQYSEATIFSQKDDTDHLLAVDINALSRDVATYDVGWRVLSFDHYPRTNPDSTYSYINLLGEERQLAAQGSCNLVPQLMPREYNYQRTSPNGHPISSTTTSAGLIGSLPLLVGLGAFSAPRDSITPALTGSITALGAWTHHDWPTGRKSRPLSSNFLAYILRHSRARDGSDDIL